MLRQFTSIFVGILLFIVVIVISSSIYIVDETKQVFETRFGKIIGDPINGPGKPAFNSGCHSSPKCTNLRNDISNGMMNRKK